jgi:predicted transcriptional regulator
MPFCLTAAVEEVEGRAEAREAGLEAGLVAREAGLEDARALAVARQPEQK